MRFFKKELPSNPLYLVSGRQVKFRAVKSGVGILATQDAGLLNELDHVVNRKIGGVIEISHPEFLKLQYPDVRPLLPVRVSFYHSGDYGDIVYSLPTIRELGGGELFLGPDNRSGMPTRQKFDKKIAQNIIPLLEAQPYLHSASFLKDVPPDLTYDLNAMRVLLRKERMDIQQGMNLARCYLRTFGLPIEHDQPRWLTVPAKRQVAPVVINRSSRYHNKTFRWDHVVTEHKGRIVFIGTREEHETFCKDWKVEIPYEPTKDLLDAACVIDGAELFVGNQSCCFAIAEGLKKRVLLERCPWVSNTIFIRDPTVKEVSAPSPPVQRSFLEQTEWEAGLFTMPTPLDLTVWYNCSIAAHDGKNWLFARRHRYDSGPKSPGESRSDLEIFEVRRNMSLRQAFLPIMPNRYPAEQWEDPRAVLGADGSMYVSFATWVHRPKPKWHVRQSLCRLTKEWTRCEVVMEPAYGGNHPVPSKVTGPEKNWVFFEHAGAWHFVYSINPHIVVQAEPGAKPAPAAPYQNKAMALPWAHGEPRGGTAPVRIGDEFLCFFHSSADWIAPKRRYFMGAYTFSAAPPFELRRITPAPLLVGSEEDFRTLDGPLVIFPNGALLEQDVWTIVFGVNDENCGWIKIPDVDLQKRLVEVGK